MNLIGKVVEKEKLIGELSQGVEYYKGERGPKGDKGEPFKYEDFTPEQLEALRGPAGKDGSNGLDGKDGKDGISITHTWNGTSLSITSASGTSEMDLQGPAGQDYVLTQDDKTEIAGLVDLTNYATTTYVDNAIANIEIPDVSGFQTEEQVNTLINQALGVIENGTY